MAYFLFKTMATALIFAGVSELSKRFSFLAALLAALPLTSVLIFIWMYNEQKDIEKISALSSEIFLLVIPSLAFFLILPFLLKRGLGFYAALGIDILATYAVYFVYIKVLRTVT